MPTTTGDFSATAGDTYDIAIRRWSGTDSVWYGVAWTVNGISLADVVAFPFDQVAISRLTRA